MRSEQENFSKEPQLIKKLFDQISKDYDKLNDIMSFGMHRAAKKDALSRIPFTIHHSPFTILDLCTGTGDLTGILKEEYPEAKIIGVDFSSKMLEIARKKHPNIEFLEADCTQLPFEDENFDLCTISFGLRNIEDMDKALGEIYRVLKKGGYFINLDLGKPNKFFNFFLKPYMFLWVSFLGKIFHGDETPYHYLAASNEHFPAQMELVKIFQKMGFTEIKNKNYLFGQIASQICKK